MMKTRDIKKSAFVFLVWHIRGVSAMPWMNLRSRRIFLEGEVDAKLEDSLSLSDSVWNCVPHSDNMPVFLFLKVWKIYKVESSLLILVYLSRNIEIHPQRIHLYLAMLKSSQERICILTEKFA